MNGAHVEPAAPPGTPENAPFLHRWRASPFLLWLIFLVLVVSRRYPQFLHPQVWNEDGVANPANPFAGSILQSFIHDGWLALFQPVNGYFLVIPKLLGLLAFKLSFSRYALCGSILAAAFAALVGCAVVYLPTRLRLRGVCAFAIFLVPSNTEVFDLTLYVFWWAAVLLLLLCLWNETDQYVALRVVILVLAGLSSPMIALVLPVLILRALVYRRHRSERMICIAACGIFLLQTYQSLGHRIGTRPSLHALMHAVVPNFFGRYLIGNLEPRTRWYWLAGMLCCLALGSLLWMQRRSLWDWTLFYLLIGAIALSVVRADPAALHPILAGPRYFFYPFLLLSWLLVQWYAVLRPSLTRWLPGALLLCTAVNALPVWSRSHDDLHWTAHALSCADFDEYTLPVQFDGHAENAWQLRLPGERCALLLQSDLMRPAKAPVYPYRVELAAFIAPSTVARRPDHIGQSLTFDLQRGDRLLYRSNSRGNEIRFLAPETAGFRHDLPVAPQWIILDFSNHRLPASFRIQIVALPGLPDDAIEIVRP